MISTATPAGRSLASETPGTTTVPPKSLSLDAVPATTATGQSSVLSERELDAAQTAAQSLGTPQQPDQGVVLRVIGKHPRVVLAAAVVTGVALGWLIKRHWR